MIREFAKFIPDALFQRSGAVFYSGRSAYQGKNDLYILGLNPGGSPEGREEETLAWHTNKVIYEDPDDWSAYRDESWRGYAPGTSGMQPRVLHFFRQLGVSAGSTPASNIIFVRSTGEASIHGDRNELAESCWPLHAAVIAELKTKVILCFGKTAGKFVQQKLHAFKGVDEFIEQNGRGWKSVTYSDPDGIRVIVATHPSRADWTKPVTDPTCLVERALRHPPPCSA